jgi:hypothetical protein
MKHLPLLLLCAALAATPALAPAGEDASPLEFFPRTRLFPKLVADGTVQGLSLGKDLATRRWNGGIGGTERILEARVAGHTLQLGVGATVYATLIRQPRVLEVVTADFFVDVPVDIALTSRLTLRTGYGHYSAHFADDGLEILGLHSINYAKDFIPLLLALQVPAIGGHVYGGGRIDYYTIPESGRHWVLQAGIEAGGLELVAGVRGYAAVDVRCKSEVHGGTTQSYQVGVRLFEREAQALRVSWTLRTGVDDRGQFYRNRITLSLLGVALDV